LGSGDAAGRANLRVAMSTVKFPVGMQRFSYGEGGRRTHAVTSDENAHSVFWNLDVCRAYIRCWHHFERVLGGVSVARL